MKKLILIFACLLFIAAGQAQQSTIVSNYDVTTTGDTLIKITTLPSFYADKSGHYTWQVSIKWSGLTGTLDGTLQMKQTALPDSLFSDDVYCDYYNLSSVTLDAANGYCNFTDVLFTGRSMGIYFDKNNISGGTISAFITIKAK